MHKNDIESSLFTLSLEVTDLENIFSSSTEKTIFVILTKVTDPDSSAGRYVKNMMVEH